MPLSFSTARARGAQLGVLLLLSCAAKFAYVFLLTDWSHYLFSDFAGYWDRAAQRAAGDVVSVNQWAIWPPLWHIVLAEIFKVLDFIGLRAHALPIVLSFNILLSTLSVYLLYRIARLLYDSHGYAMLVAAVYAFFYPLLYFNAFVMSEHVAVTAVIAALFVMLRHDSARAAAGGGLLLALAVAMRPAFGLLGGLFFLYLVFRKRLSWAAAGQAAVFALTFFALLFLVAVENSAISKGRLKGLSAGGGLNFYFAQCRSHSVTNVAEGYRFVIIPPATVNHPEYGSLTVSRPIHDQAYFYKLGWECLRANPGHLADAARKLDALYFGPLLPSVASARGFDAMLGTSRHLAFGMSLLALFFPLLLRMPGINRPAVVLLAAIPLVSIVTMYFFNIEHRYLYSFIFAIQLLSLLLAWKWTADWKRNMLPIALFGTLLSLVYLGNYVYGKMHIQRLERNLALTITQNNVPVLALDQPRMAVSSARFMTDRIDFPDSDGLRHYLLGELGWKRYFFIDAEMRFEVEAPGEYEFFVYSDDGARLQIDGGIVSEFVAPRPMGESVGRIYLRRGVHSLKIAYFQNEGSCGLKAVYRRRDFPMQRYYVGQDSEWLKWGPHAAAP